MDEMRAMLMKAVEREEDAVKFYGNLKTKLRSPGTAVFMDEMIAEERRHKEVLLTFLEEPEVLATFEPRVAQDLGIASLVEPASVDADLTYQDALIVAMKREEGSIKFYEGLRRTSRDAAVVRLLDTLVAEEKIHREKLEREYDQNVLTED